MEFPVFSVHAHSEIINSIDGVGGLNIGAGAPEIVTGSREGVVKVWDIRQNSPVATMEPGEGENKRDCWTVTFGNCPKFTLGLIHELTNPVHKTMTRSRSFGG